MTILRGAAVAAVLALALGAAVPAEAAMMERHHGMMGHHQMMHRPLHRPMMHHGMMRHHRMNHGMMHHHRMHRGMMHHGMMRPM